MEGERREGVFLSPWSAPYLVQNTRHSIPQYSTVRTGANRLHGVVRLYKCLTQKKIAESYSRFGRGSPIGVFHEPLDGILTREALGVCLIQ